MKVHKLALLIIVQVCAWNAEAQSSVTMYGRVSGALNYTNHMAQPGGGSASEFSFGSYQWGTSFLGLMGDEYLGSGYHAVFHLEDQFFSGDGTPVSNILWNRLAQIGIAKDGWGTLLLGRAMALTDGESYYLDPMQMQIISIGTLANGRNWGTRGNNITFNSSRFNGFSFRLQAGLGNEPGDFSANRQLSASVAYTGGDLDARAIYEEIRDAKGSFDNLYSASRLYVAGASYTIGSLKLFGGYTGIRAGGNVVADASNPTGSTKNDMIWGGANYAITPELNLIGGVYQAWTNRNGGSATLAAVGVTYFVSKKTMLSATVGTVFNKGNAVFPVENGTPGPVAGGSQQAVYVGMVNSF